MYTDDSAEGAMPALPLSLIDQKGEESGPKRYSPNPKETLTKVERRDVIDRKNKPPKMPLAIVDRDLSTLALHSPSSQIIGTPFALASTSTPFEYPFPETPPPSSSSSASASASSSPPIYYNNNHTFVLGPSFPTNHHHNINTSSTPTFTTNYNYNASRVNHHQNHHPYSKSPPKLLHTLGAHIQPPSHGHAHGHGHLTSPPIPPSLVRKRAAAATSGRWNVHLRGDGSSGHSRSGSGEIHGDPAFAAGPAEEEDEEDNDNLGLGDDDYDDDDAGINLDDRGSRCPTSVIHGTFDGDPGRGYSSRRRQ